MRRVLRTVCRFSLLLSTLGVRAACAQEVPLTPPGAVAPVHREASTSDGRDVRFGFFGGVFGGSPSLFQSYSLVDGSGSHFAGLDIGYDRHLRPQITVGATADLAFVAEPVVAATAFDETPTLFGSVRGRLGYRRQRWRASVTGGFAWTRDQVTVMNTAATAAFARRLGWTAGAGIDRALTSAWGFNAEYLYSRFGAADFGAFPEAHAAPTLSMQQLRIGVSYALTGSSGSDEAHPTIAPLDVSGWTMHGQMTYVSQYAAPFRAPYRGTNSLDPNAGRETGDVTVYLGRRLWEGAAVWINPEIDQGFGLSNTLGVAGFTSGEAYKLGYTYPYVRVPRAFLQQTINLGGAEETVDSSLNQFASTRTANRVVVTAGKFSVSDLFDTISYAHDPRNDFMNWALVDAGTFDYAADAWGFTYGAALEWYQSAWTARAGFFDLSNVPNSADLDSTFGQYQLVWELEHRHAIHARTGKLALVGFVTRGRMGNFDDAVALARSTGEPADMAAVRRYNTRTGVNLNGEQQLADDFGMFGRAGWADGSLEPYEFADIDRTVSAGVSLGGARWGRRADTLAVAAVINDISSSHRAYLNAGGLGILVGDGQLPHPGTERIIETFYRIPMGSWQITADYQFVVNPAYNRDRGPVSDLAIRLHTQF
jgi:high affinity Mn2+ porin